MAEINNGMKTRSETLAVSGRRDQQAASMIETRKEARPVGDQAAAQRKMSVVVVKEITELESYLPAWEKLVEEALEPNVFYEPWMLLPGFRAFSAGKNLQFVLIFTPDPARVSGPPILCGFFPLEIRSHYRGLAKKLPIKTLSLWKWEDEFCYLCTPLLRTEYARECLSAFFDWLAAGTHGCGLMEFGFINGDGPFHQLVVDHFYDNPQLPCVTDCFTRALFRPAVDAEEYLRSALPGNRRKELRRQERRLAEMGQLEYRILEPGGDVATWIEEFLQLEAKSWKGPAGRALVCNEQSRTFFVAIATEAFHRGQLMMLSLELDGRPIAHKCNFLAAPGSFAIKIAFDEEYARFSPGVLLEMENIRQLHARSQISWMDSCADPDRLMINRLWQDRRTIPTLVVGTGRRPGDFVVAAIPLLRWLNRRLGRPRLNGIER